MPYPNLPDATVRQSLADNVLTHITNPSWSNCLPPATSISNVQTPSRASPAPTEISAVHKCCAHHKNPVGAGLPAMAISLPHQCRIRRRHRGQARLPQRYLPYTNAAPAKKKPVGAGLPAMAISLPHQCRMCRRHRLQAGSHSDLRRTQILRPPPIPVGARLAPDGNLPATSISNVQTPSPAGWLPQWSASNINTASTTIPLWERACPRWLSPCHINVECADAIACRLAPTVICAVHKCCVHQQYLWERRCDDSTCPRASVLAG